MCATLFLQIRPCASSDGISGLAFTHVCFSEWRALFSDIMVKQHSTDRRFFFSSRRWIFSEFFATCCTPPLTAYFLRKLMTRVTRKLLYSLTKHAFENSVARIRGLLLCPLLKEFVCSRRFSMRKQQNQQQQQQYGDDFCTRPQSGFPVTHEYACGYGSTRRPTRMSITSF